jgi:hypothetical protein
MGGWPADIPTRERKRKRRFVRRSSANRWQIHPRARRRGGFVRRAGAEGWRPRECVATPKRIETKVPCYRARGEWIGERTARCEIGLLVEVGAWCLFPPSLLPSFPPSLLPSFPPSTSGDRRQQTAGINGDLIQHIEVSATPLLLSSQLLTSNAIGYIVLNSKRQSAQLKLISLKPLTVHSQPHCCAPLTLDSRARYIH